MIKCFINLRTFCTLQIMSGGVTAWTFELWMAHLEDLVHVEPDVIVSQSLVELLEMKTNIRAFANDAATEPTTTNHTFIDQSVI